MRRILKAGDLHQDAIVALALDHRFDRAELVDAALDDLDRLLDGLAHALDNGRLRESQADQSATSIGDVEVALVARAEQAANRLRQITQLGQRGLEIGVLDTYLDRIATCHETGIADLGLAQRAAHIVADMV